MLKPWQSVSSSVCKKWYRLFKVGHESGKLADMLARVAHMYQARLMRTLSRINTLFQPFLLIILGLMIAGLILGIIYPNYESSYAYKCVLY